MSQARDPQHVPPGSRNRGRPRRWVSRGRRRLALSTVLAVGLVGVVGGAATADGDVRTRTTSAHGAMQVTQMHCWFRFWCRPVHPEPTPPSPVPSSPSQAPTADPTSPVPPTGTTAPTTAPTTTATPTTTTSSPPSGTPSAPATETPTTAPTPTATPTNSPSPDPDPGDVRTRQVLDRINAARAEAGLAPLAMSEGLIRSAEAHTQLMASGCGMEHQCPGEASLGDRISAQSVSWSSAGENIGYGGPVADTDEAIAGVGLQLTDAMLAETPPNDGHRRNILSTSFRYVGISLFRDTSGTVWMTQDFTG